MSRGPCLAGAFLCLLLAGCHNGMQQQAVSDDPLRGGTVSPTTPTAPSSTLSGSRAAADEAPNNKGQLPPVLAPTGTTSPAALASGMEQSLDGLRIADTVSLPGNASASGVHFDPIHPVDHLTPQPINDPDRKAPLASGDDAPVILDGPLTLEGPQTIPQAGPPATGPLPAPPVVPPAAPVPGPRDQTPLSTSAQLQKQLDDYGVTERELTRTSNPNEWKFKCRIPDPYDPESGITFQSSPLAGPDGRDDGGQAAIRSVLAKIDQELHRR